MRITWMCACEQVVLMSDGRPYAMGIFTGEIPWIPPQIKIPMTVLFSYRLDPEDAQQKKLTVRIVDNHDKPLAKFEAMLPPNPKPGNVAWANGIVGGLMGVGKPGEYEIQLLLDGQALDDAPTWKLRFRDVRPAGAKPGEGADPKPPPPPTPPPAR